MGVTNLTEAVARIALEVHPDRINSLCSALRSNTDANILGVVKAALGASFSPQLLKMLAATLKANPNVSPGELSAMFYGASATASLAASGSSVELVWTGPATGIVPIRHTAQVLTGLIDEARERLFLVSFVAYHVSNVIAALQRALMRGVQIDVLLEASAKQGGNVTVDSVSILKNNLPLARFYHWQKVIGDLIPSASVHAKCAVADGRIAFVTSANLSEAALDRNMEVGILVHGGVVPGQLSQHLQALIITKQLKPV